MPCVAKDEILGMAAAFHGSPQSARHYRLDGIAGTYSSFSASLGRSWCIRPAVLTGLVLHMPTLETSTEGVSAVSFCRVNDIPFLLKSELSLHPWYRRSISLTRTSLLLLAVLLVPIVGLHVLPVVLLVWSGKRLVQTAAVGFLGQNLRLPQEVHP